LPYALIASACALLYLIFSITEGLERDEII